jgi:hypothetical protein
MVSKHGDGVSLPGALVRTIADVFEPLGLVVANAVCEAESAEYSACRLWLDGREVAFREAKTTPTKIGQFVTLWKRPSPRAAIVPLDADDNISRVVVAVSNGMSRGQFVFDISVLVDFGVMSVNGRGGKRAIRVYPPWAVPTNPQAVRTQIWQLERFLAVDAGQAVDQQLARQLYGLPVG